MSRSKICQDQHHKILHTQKPPRTKFEIQENTMEVLEDRSGNACHEGGQLAAGN